MLDTKQLVNKMVQKDIRGMGGAIFLRQGSILNEQRINELVKAGISLSVIEYCCEK